MGEGEPAEDTERSSHVTQLERCHCGPTKIESVSYSLPDGSFISLTRCANCGGLTDWKIRKHESKSGQKTTSDPQPSVNESAPATEDPHDETQDSSSFSDFIHFLERETIALLIVGMGVTVFAMQWGLTAITGAAALLSFLIILPLLYLTNSEY